MYSFTLKMIQMNLLKYVQVEEGDIRPWEVEEKDRKSTIICMNLEELEASLQRVFTLGKLSAHEEEGS